MMRKICSCQKEKASAQWKNGNQPKRGLKKSICTRARAHRSPAQQLGRRSGRPAQVMREGAGVAIARQVERERKEREREMRKRIPRGTHPGKEELTSKEITFNLGSSLRTFNGFRPS